MQIYVKGWNFQLVFHSNVENPGYLVDTVFSNKGESCVQNVSWIQSYSTFNDSQLLFIILSSAVAKWVTYKRVSDWMIEFFDTVYTELRTTGNYSAIVIYTIYSSLSHPLVSSVFTSRILATDS
jgi:hypothetical protein